MLNFFKNKEVEEVTAHSEFDKILSEIEQEVANNPENQYFYSHSQLKISASPSYQKFKLFKPAEKTALMLYLQGKVVKLYAKSHKKIRYTQYNTTDYKSYAILQNLFSLMMRNKMQFTQEQVLQLFNAYFAAQKKLSVKMPFAEWPINSSANQLIKFCQTNQLSDEFVSQIKKLLAQKAFTNTYLYSNSDIEDIKDKILLTLNNNSNDIPTALTFQANNDDQFGVYLNQFLQNLSADKQQIWHNLLHHCQQSKASKPSKPWLAKANLLIDELTIKSYKSSLQNIIKTASSLENIEHTTTHNFNNHTYEHTHSIFMDDKSKAVLKGLIWTLIRFHDTNTLQDIARLTERCFQKIPGIGPAAAGLGNAGIYVLAQSKGMEGIGHLSRLKLRIKQNNTQKLINKYISEQAEKLGLLPSQIEEIAAPDFNLVLGERTELFNDYQLSLKLTGVGKTEMQWQKPDGKLQKTVPAFVKNSNEHSKLYKKLQNVAKQIKQSSTAQRDRIDRFYTEDREWNFEDFKKYYFDHGLINIIARKLIWLVKIDNQWVAAFFFEDQWQDISGNKLKLDKNTKVRLWHPIDSVANEVLAWRNKLEQWQIQQPVKQAYREIYLLTDAEINSRSYSNRMAAHFLKQHQFNALTAVRDWKYTLLGAFDNGVDGGIAEKFLPTFEMKAQFWIYELNDTEEFNDTGIWDYVATDQVKFLDKNNETIDLINIDKLIFSEIMRDADLFVGVCSVGNDPQWTDNGGHAQFRDYWQSYSFGDLSEIAKTRKQVLERLIPRLKIKDISHIEGQFLVVNGVKNTYKIHIGSTNILICPNDRYLCIVPGRGQDKKLDNIYLPFEGDRGLSILLSKAFLLAADDKISDKTILSQLP